MPEYRWAGGAGAVAQQVTLTPAGDLSDGGTFTTTMTDESGGTQQIITTTTATTVATIIDAIMADLTATTAGSLFQAVTFSDQSTTIRATADVAGIPFLIAGAATSTATAATNYTVATATGNSGPNDVKTLANYISQDGTAATATMVNGDTLRIVNSVHPMKYGLRATGLNLEALYVGETMEGSVGDPVGGHKLAVNVNNTSTASVVALSGGAEVLWEGTTPQVIVSKSPLGANAVKLDGDIGSVRVTGRVLGLVTVDDGCVLDNFYQYGAPNAVALVGAVTSLDTVNVGSGRAIVRASASTAQCSNGAELVHEATSTGTVLVNLRNFGGTVLMNSGGTVTNVDNYDGLLDLRQSHAGAITFTNTTLHGGELNSRGSLANVTFTNTVKSYGGVANIDSGTVDNYAF